MRIDAAAEIRGSSRVTLHELSVHAEGDEWYVGRVDTGEFVVLPDIGVRVLRRLPAATVDEVTAEFAADEVDVADFVSSLVDLGFVASIDRAPTATPAPRRPTFPWLRTRHVRLLLRPAVPVVLLLVVLAGGVAVLLVPDAMPGYRDVLWTSHGSLVLLVNSAIGWLMLLGHETAHLVTARAAGVPGRMSFGTRLQFLVAQTDVSGVWSAPRRVRLTVYCAGMALELTVVALGLLVLAVFAPGGAMHGILAALVLFTLRGMPWEAMVFMRTDLYFVLQDLSRCPNLFAAGSDYTRYLLGRVRRRPRGPDPTAAMSVRQRRTVRAYTVLLVLGTAGCLLVYVAISLPIMVTLVANAVRGLAHADGVWPILDAVVVLGLTGLVQGLWARSWWRKHRDRVRAGLRRALDRFGRLRRGTGG